MSRVTSHTFFFLLTICVLAVTGRGICAPPWSQLKEQHFVVYYTPDDESLGRLVLRKAEEYYSRIALEIGYSRYSTFWTWDDRVKIFIFPDQKSYRQSTGQPQWSTGYANKDSHLFKTRMIVTFRQEDQFLDGLLPHEISHLILHDFVGFERTIPIWFDEGVAQLNESDKKNIAHQVMTKLIVQNQFIPLDALMQWDIRRETDSKKVSVFYAQSVSVVDFLIHEYGSDAFSFLCRNLKDGKDMEEAIRVAYSGSLDSVSILQEKWMRYMKK